MDKKSYKRQASVLRFKKSHPGASRHFSGALKEQKAVEKVTAALAKLPPRGRTKVLAALRILLDL